MNTTDTTAIGQTSDYLIGGHHIRFTGTALHHTLSEMPGFSPFRTSPAQEPPLLTFHWDDDGPTAGISTATPDGYEKLYDVTMNGIRSLLCREKGEPHYHYLTQQDNRQLAFSFRAGTSKIQATGQATPDALRFALWIAYGLATVPFGTIAIHSSAILYQGRVVLFLGESGTGKSTHTRLWQQYLPGARLLNDDSPVLRVTDGQPFVFGSPWSGKTHCYQPISAPLAALVRLSQAPANHIRRLTILEAFAAVHPSCPPAFARDNVLADHICATLSSLLATTPVYALACLPDEAAARLACDTLFDRQTDSL